MDVYYEQYSKDWARDWHFETQSRLFIAKYDQKAPRQLMSLDDTQLTNNQTKIFVKVSYWTFYDFSIHFALFWK